MTLRWYSVVVDTPDPRALARWWAEAIDWRIVFESDDEVALVPGYVRGEEDVRAMDWERMPPGLVFVRVPEPKTAKNRLHIDLAPHTSQDREAEIARLEALGATRVDVGQGPDASWTVLADPEGNEFCVLSARDM
ncbi:MAG TPA: VOC family protein [Actinotalea caeni]|uniref:VOC family protein n=1 Tax=Actinotalea caeni TaxID=1348467 RepID=UPI0012E17962|nr:VOC family protein [Actinotalea caeni]HLV55498.1 VOC family protein [Actinotalea caeni]